MTEREISVSDLSRIKILRIFIFKPLRRAVRIMGIIEMNPTEPEILIILLYPILSQSNDLFCGAFDFCEFVDLAGIAIKIIIHLKTLIEAKPVIKGKSPDKSSGPVFFFLQDFR